MCRRTAVAVSVAVVFFCSAASLAQEPKAAASQPSGFAPTPATKNKVAAEKRTARRGQPENILDIHIDALSYEEVPLRKVINDLARKTGTNIVVRWTRLREAGVPADLPISLQATNMKLRRALWLVLWLAAPEDTELGYMLQDDLILVSTLPDLDSQLVTRAYDVGELILPELASIAFSDVGLGTRVTGMYPCVAPGVVAHRPETKQFGSGVEIEGRLPGAPLPGSEYDATAQMQLLDLIDVITSTVEPESWAVNGGKGTIMRYRKVLVVRNSPRVHRILAGFMHPAPVGAYDAQKPSSEKP